MINLIEATYKTTKYDLALFFICVKTNVGYSVVAEFVVQSETAESISEALAKLKLWNPNWCPPYFMSDYSEAELVALEEVFPATTVYLCDFHREQAWDRWAKDHKHGLSQYEAEEKTSGSKHRIDFCVSTSEEMPSCTCKDWLRHHIPCKHFFAIFTHQPAWQWNNLPQTYLQSAYLSTDTQALHDYFQPPTDNLADPSITDTEEHPSPESNSTATSLPKPVSIHQNVLIQCMYMLKCIQECVNTYNVMLKNAGERAWITLKSLESLTYICTDANKLVDLDPELKHIRVQLIFLHC